MHNVSWVARPQVLEISFKALTAWKQNTWQHQLLLFCNHATVDNQRTPTHNTVRDAPLRSNTSCYHASLKRSTHLNHFKHPKCNNQLQHLKHLGDFKHLNHKTNLNSRSRSACGDPQALTCSRLLGCVTHHECIVCIAQRMKTEKVPYQRAVQW